MHGGKKLERKAKSYNYEQKVMKVKLVREGMKNSLEDKQANSRYYAYLNSVATSNIEHSPEIQIIAEKKRRRILHILNMKTNK